LVIVLDSHATADESTDVAMAVLTGVAMLLPLALLVFTCVYRKHPVVRAAAPEFLAVMIVGALAILCSVFTWMLYVTDAACILRPWLVVLGFDLMFGALVAKSWRLTKIFLVKRFTRIKVTAAHTFLVLMLILSVDVVGAAQQPLSLSRMRAVRACCGVLLRGTAHSVPVGGAEDDYCARELFACV
jgi:7 transmembrane sweet-taste receptor of 3 GCPR